MIIAEKPTVPELFAKSKEDIMFFPGKIYEHSSWITEKLYEEYLEG